MLNKLSLTCSLALLAFPVSAAFHVTSHVPMALKSSSSPLNAVPAWRVRAGQVQGRGAEGRNGQRWVMLGWADGLKETLGERLAATNAEMLAKKEGSKLIGAKTGGVGELKSVPAAAIQNQEKGAKAARILDIEGCLGVKNVLSPETAAKVLEYIREEGAQSQELVDSGEILFDDRFGGVNCRGFIPGKEYGIRQDLFLPVSNPIVKGAIEEALGNLQHLVVAASTPEGMLHEISSLVAYPGSPRQCIHADTIVLPCPQYPDASMPPLYTFFIALQDVEDNMGHTVFLPRTHTPDAHKMWNVPQTYKEKMIEGSPAVQSKLECGDVAIFDSRLLHCGRENSSDKLRVLFYFTISSAQRWALPDGLHGSNSVRKEDRWKWRVEDFLPNGGKPGEDLAEASA